MPLTPDEIKAIGEIELGPAKHEVFLNKHYKKLIYGGIALAVLASAATAWYAYGEQQESEAGALIVQSVTKPGYAVQSLDTVITEYPDTASKETAAYLKAVQDMADPAFVDFSVMKNLADNAESDMVRILACHALAARYTQDGDAENATAYWKKVINFPRNVYTAHAYINLCDIAWNKGDKEQAVAYLLQGKEACPDSVLFNGSNSHFVKVRFDLLESGVDAPVDAIFTQSMQPAEQPAPVDPVQPILPTADTEAGTLTAPEVGAPSMPSTLDGIPQPPAAN